MTRTRKRKNKFACQAKTLGAVCLGLGLVASHSGAALAQDSADEDVSPNFSVSERFESNFAVDGVRAGSFVLFPLVRYNQVYSDNIFGETTNKVDDFIADINGAIALRSDWDVHSLDLFGGVRRFQYFDNTNESTTDYNVGGEGALDLGRRARAIFTAEYSRLTESRRSLQTAFGDEPVQFSVFRTSVDFDIRHNRFREQFGVIYTKDDFFDVNEIFDPLDPTPGEVIDQDFRDRDAYEVYFRESFRVRPTVAIFAEFRGEVQEFNALQQGFNTNQDSQTYSVLGGVALDINKVARGEVSVGYQKRNFDSDAFVDISGLNVDAALDYYLTDLTTVSLSARRRIENTAFEGFAGFYSTSAEIEVEHELLRRVLVTAGAEYVADDFRDSTAIPIDRTDKFFRVSAGVRYAFRRNVVLAAEYIHNDARSTGADARPEFTENIVQISLELRR